MAEPPTASPHTYQSRPLPLLGNTLARARARTMRVFDEGAWICATWQRRVAPFDPGYVSKCQE
jgi:hypothetical protein